MYVVFALQTKNKIKYIDPYISHYKFSYDKREKNNKNDRLIPLLPCQIQSYLPIILICCERHYEQKRMLDGTDRIFKAL